MIFQYEIFILRDKRSYLYHNFLVSELKYRNPHSGFLYLTECPIKFPSTVLECLTETNQLRFSTSETTRVFTSTQKGKVERC